MCLITEQMKPEILKEDLVVYKCLDGRNSIFYDYKWTKNRMAKTNFSSGKINTCKTFAGCYSDDIAERTYKKQNRILLCVHRGFHACLTFARAMEYDYSGKSICEMKIPKSARVFKDSTGLIVSNKMMLIKPAKVKIKP